MPLPGTLEPGTYLLEIWLAIGGNERQVDEEVYSVIGDRMYLPLIRN